LIHFYKRYPHTPAIASGVVIFLTVILISKQL